jgi:rod shape-determining protein MreC
MRSRRPYYFLAVFALPLLVFLQNPLIKEPLRGVSFAVLKPFFVMTTATIDAFSSGKDNITRFWKTFHIQPAHESRIAELESELIQAKEMAKENERLRKLLEFRDTLAGKRIAAQVIGWDPSPWRKTLILDKGTNQGIRKDMAVVVPEGLIGRILETGPSTSRVILLQDSDSRVSAIADQSRAQGVVAGGGREELTLEYLELESGVAVGEAVLTSGLNGLFPKGIQIGKITSLSKDATGLHLQAKIQSSVRFSKLEEVICLGSSQGK